MGSFEARRLAGIVQSEIRLMTAECVRVGGINLAQGICDLAVPAAVLEGAERALRGPTNTYSKAAGIAELRHAIAAKLLRDNGIKADPESEIVVTAGVTGAYSCTLHALLNPGDGLLLFEPYYAYHRNIAASLELDVQYLELDPPHATISQEVLRASLAPNTRAMVVCTPSNPTGKMFARAELEAIAAVAHERDLLVITDEIYEYFTYDGRPHVSPASVGDLWDRTVTLMGCSKTFAITGWRIGYAVAPEPLARSILVANDLYFICANRPAQHGVAHAIETLPPEWYRDLARAFESKRDRLCRALSDAGLDPLIPQGAYYALADVSRLGHETARGAALDLLERCGVAAVPGNAFCRGPRGQTLLRFCFAKEDDVLDEACRRLRTLAG